MIQCHRHHHIFPFFLSFFLSSFYLSFLLLERMYSFLDVFHSEHQLWKPRLDRRWTPWRLDRSSQQVFSSGPVWWSHPLCVWKAARCLLVLLLSVRSLALAVHSRLLGVKTPRCKSCCKHNIDAGSASAGRCRAKVRGGTHDVFSSLRRRNSFILVLPAVVMCGGSFHHQVGGLFSLSTLSTWVSQRDTNTKEHFFRFTNLLDLFSASIGEGTCRRGLERESVWRDKKTEPWLFGESVLQKLGYCFIIISCFSPKLLTDGGSSSCQSQTGGQSGKASFPLREAFTAALCFSCNLIKTKTPNIQFYIKPQITFPGFINFKGFF